MSNERNRCLSPVIWFLIMTFAAVSSMLSVADAASRDADRAIYSRTASLPPLRVAAEDMQVVLDKAKSLMSAAIAGFPHGPLFFETTLYSGRLVVTIKSDELEKFGEHRPPVNGAASQAGTAPAHDLGRYSKQLTSVDRFTFNVSDRLAYDFAPVSYIRMDFSDFERTIQVAGTSQEQVDAIFSTLRDDLTGLSSLVGGTTTRLWIYLVGGIVLGTVAANFGLFWFRTRNRKYLPPLVLSVFCFVGLLILPIDRLLAGFLMTVGDASFLVRYGPEISFLGLVVGVFAIPLTYSRAGQAMQKKTKKTYKRRR